MKKLIDLINIQKQEQKVNKKSVKMHIPRDVNDPGVSLVDGIDNLLGSDIKPFFKKSIGFAPSDNNPCPRYWIYKFRGVEFIPDYTPRTQRIFDVGHDVHERIQGYFERMGILFGKELPVPQLPEHPPISGFCDAIIQWGEKRVVEIKSISQEGYIYRENFRKPKDDHNRQIQIYMHYFNIPSGIILYENKNNQHMLAFAVEKDDVLIQNTLKKYAKIYEAYQKNILPSRPYKETSKNCQNCRVKDFCWKDNDEGIKI